MTDMANISRDLKRLQARRKVTIWIAILPLAPFLFFTTSSAHPGSIYKESLEFIGLFLIFLGVIGRAWSTLYIGGRKARELVTTGPYSVSRNPLYLFSFIAVAGLGAQTGSIVISSLLVLGSLVIFVPLVMSEENALRKLFGNQFDVYRMRVPRFVPQFSEWRDAPSLQIDPKLYRRTMLDGLIILCLAPAIHVAGWLRNLGPILPLLQLP